MEQITKQDKLEVKNNIIKNSVPTIMSFIFADFFTIIDTVLLGTIKDESTYAASLSAINVTSRILAFISAFTRGMNVASSTILARYDASQNKEKMQSTLIHTILLNVFMISIPIFILVISFMKPIMLFIGNDSAIYDVGKGYYIAVMIGFVFSSFNNIMVFLTRAVCESKRSLKLEMFSNVFNVIGDVVLINGLWIFPKLGVTGAGIATLIYKIALFAMYMWVLFKSDSKLRIDFKYKFKFDKEMIKNILHIGIPASSEVFAIRGANVLFTKIIATMGTTVLAAQQICITIFSFIVEVGNALTVSIAPLVSKSIGEKRKNIAKLYIKTSKKISIIFSSIIGGIILIFSNPILNLYTDSDNIKSIVKTVLLIIIISQYAQNIQDVYAGGLRRVWRY